MVAGRHRRLAHLRRQPDRSKTVLFDATSVALTVQFEITHEARDSRARVGLLRTLHGEVETPFFCPVAAAGSVEGITPAELRALGASVLLASTYDLFLRPGQPTVGQFGGLHRWLAWDGPLMTDSGGSQVFALGWRLEPRKTPNQAPRLVRIDEDGAAFTSHIDGSRQRLTPESSIAMQEVFGADIVLAFAEPTSTLHAADYTQRAMERTHRWAGRCIEARQRSDQALYGIVQGGAFEDLRTASAKFIGDLPFDGVTIGGSLGRSTADLAAVVDWTLPHVPSAWPRHVLGIGEPEELFACVERGVDGFDSASPTRLGRQGYVYTVDGVLQLTLAKWTDDPRPIDAECGCYSCRTGFSRGYLRHLFAANELLASTLASLHNLFFIQHLLRQIRAAIRAESLTLLRDEFLSRYCAIGLASA